MSYSQLLEEFFKTNKLSGNTPSAQALVHFYIKLDDSPEAADRINSMLSEMTYQFKPERKSESSPEKSEIESATSYEQVIRIMRRGADPMNHDVLISKAMDFEDEIVPDMVARLKTSMNDSFIEIATRALVKSNSNVTDDIVGYYDDMRSPYAQSVALILLGFKADETLIPWLIEKYDELKKRYPNKSYCEGAYIALQEIWGTLS